LTITIKAKVCIIANGSRCTVSKPTGEPLGYFHANGMEIYAEGDPLPYKTTFKATGATPADWTQFKRHMHLRNGTALSDMAMPSRVREWAKEKA
jgi:hypothetical protein